MKHQSLHNIISECSFGAAACLAITMVDYAQDSLLAAMVMMLSLGYCLLWGLVNSLEEWR